MTNMYSPWVQRAIIFLRNMFHALFVFFPGFLFLFLTMVAFWNLSQGEDLMVLATEQRWFFIFFELLLAFLVLVSWYAARIVANAKKSSPNTAPGYLGEKYYTHIPRFIGFSFFTVILLAFAQTPFFFRENVPSWIFYALLVLSVPYYKWLSKIFTRRFKVIKLNRLFYGTLGIILLGTIILTYNIGQYDWWVLTLMVILLLILQASFLVLVITRREMIERQVKEGKLPDKPFGKLAKKTAEMACLPHEEINFHFGFLIISVFALLVYFACTVNIAFAVRLGSFSFVLLAFAVFLGVGFILSFVSIRVGLNIHFVVLFFIFLFGQWTERHYVALVEKDAAVVDSFSNKAKLRDYFLQWVRDRDSLISQSTEFPVYFVLSDGGASRSGYWVGSVLGRLEDISERRFSKHLFCLSGASGGSVGNAAFYALLNEASTQPNGLLANNQSFYTAGTEYLRSDFLTYTLSRMLGHDFFVQALPFKTGGDRAKALTDALETAPPDSVLLKSKLALPLSRVAIYRGKVRTDLPIICINATRMQDGQPSVISTIDIDTPDFNNRVDILDKLQRGKDMKLSTAVVLGASFPYLSPAGRIDELRKSVMTEKTRIWPNYFVDGGYVDNSGAGVVHEMLIKLNSLCDSISKKGTDTAYSNKIGKLRFYVIHINNGRNGELLLEKVNPFVNDLAAPIKTLVGTYNVQTSVNDSRLKNYLVSLYHDNAHYKPINLYHFRDSLTYSMNWVISKRTLDSMDMRLNSNEVKNYMDGILKEMNR